MLHDAHLLFKLLLALRLGADKLLEVRVPSFLPNFCRLNLQVKLGLLLLLAVLWRWCREDVQNLDAAADTRNIGCVVVQAGFSKCCLGFCDFLVEYGLV